MTPHRTKDRLVQREVAKYIGDIQKARAALRPEPHNVITISREAGTGGRHIAAALGATLQFTIWDKQILDVLAHQSGWDFQGRMFEALDEQTQNAVDLLVDDFFGHINKYEYFYLLPKAIYLIAQNNAVILGRGAHLLLPNSYRVRIRASFATRVRNIMEGEGLDMKTARSLVEGADQKRSAFLKELARKIGDTDSNAAWDIELNCDRFDVQAATSLILHGFELFKASVGSKKPVVSGGGRPSD